MLNSATFNTIAAIGILTFALRNQEVRFGNNEAYKTLVHAIEYLSIELTDEELFDIFPVLAFHVRRLK